MFYPSIGKAGGSILGKFTGNIFKSIGSLIGKLLSKETDKVVEKTVAQTGKRIPLNLQLFAKKKDIGQIESIAKEFKMTPQQRREFGDYIEFLKKHVPNNKNFSYKELKEKAREFLDE